jgi:hypothetical protein
MLHADRSELTTATTDILNTMFLLCRHLSLYSEENNLVEQATAKLMRGIGDVRAVDGDILVAVAKHGFMTQGEFINQKSQLFTSFAQRMFQHGISSFAFVPGLTVPSLYAFLRLLLRNSAETWDEGGIGLCLKNRDIVGIQVTEMSESDFRLLDAATEQGQIDELQASSDLWKKFARSVLNSLTGEALPSGSGEELTSAELAQRISELLVGRTVEEKEALTLKLTSFATTLQREKMRTTRISALLSLADFVNSLSDDLRQRVLGGLSRLQMAEDFAEDFFNGLSNQAILDVFRQTTEQHEYVPPIVMSLVGKLAGSRKLVSDEQLAAHQSAGEELSRKVSELFRPDEFKKYVPSRYQKALMQVLGSQPLPRGLSVKLEELKKSLEEFQQERQLARLSLHLLDNEPDDEYASCLRERLVDAMQFFLDAADYSRLVNLCRSTFLEKTEEECRKMAGLIPDSFTEQVLGDAGRLGREYHVLISEVIALVGTPFVRPLLECTATESDRSVRLFYLNCLKKLGGDVIDHAVLFLADHRWFVQRNMLILIGELGTADTLPKVRPLLGHPHQKVRQEALKTCLLLGDDESRQTLIEKLSSGNRQDVLHAITMSQMVDNPQLSTALLEKLQEKKFFSFDFDVKKALVRALAEHRNRHALAVFSGMLNSRRLFKADLYDRLKVEIVKALVKYPASEVTAILEQQTKSGSKDVANQARQVMNKLSREGVG